MIIFMTLVLLRRFLCGGLDNICLRLRYVSRDTSINILVFHCPFSLVRSNFERSFCFTNIQNIAFFAINFVYNIALPIHWINIGFPSA